MNEYVAGAKKTSPNESLKAMFSDMYRKTLRDHLGKDEPDKASADMLHDFNSYIITKLKFEFSNKNKELYPHKNAGMSRLERYRLIENVWNDLPKNDTDLVADKYKNGEIRIRDMMEYANSCTVYSKLDRNTTTILASYAEALKSVNATRSFFWKVFHPFRNHAEKRDAKQIQSIVTEINGEYGYKSAVKRASEGLLNFADVKSITTHYTLGVYKVEEYDPNKKENLIDDLDPFFDREKLDQLLADENDEPIIDKAGVKESISINSLKEEPFANNGSAEKIDDVAKSAPNLQK